MQALSQNCSITIFLPLLSFYEVLVVFEFSSASLDDITLGAVS